MHLVHFYFHFIFVQFKVLTFQVTQFKKKKKRYMHIDIDHIALVYH